MLSAKDYRAIVSGQRRRPLDALIRCGLAIVEVPYACAMQIRNRRFDHGHLPSHRVEVPVISVGNLTLGGTGKTPMVAWLAGWLRQRQIRVSIVSRGYGAGQDSRNDEAREIEARLPDVPHVQNPDRVAAARIAIDELGTQMIILDDGFQHRRLARDLDLVLIDATEPFGFDRVFPRGMLREPLSGLQRADAVVLTRCDLVAQESRQKIRQRVTQIAPQAKWIEVAFRPSHLFSASGRTKPLASISGSPIAAFCGIGNPSAFRETLTTCGLNVKALREFPDHHQFGRQDIDSLTDWVRQDTEIEAVVCTHKDLVKISIDQLADKPLYAIAIDLDIQVGEGELVSALLSVTQPMSRDVDREPSG